MKRSNFLKTLFAIPLIPLVGNVKAEEIKKEKFELAEHPKDIFPFNHHYYRDMMEITRIGDERPVYKTGGIWHHLDKYRLDIPDSKIDELVKRPGGFDMMTILNECE